MIPMYRYPDSYPMNGNQMPSNQNYYPSFEAVPHFSKVDPSKSIVFNQPWPYANNVGPSGPCYPCYGHDNFPACYGYRPCPYFSSPQFHYCGYHPPFPYSFPTHYVPPNYMSELPRYEFDKLRDNCYHCCGCPNHSHDQRKGENVKIEEEDGGEKQASESLVPFELKNYPYPVLWIPPEYTKNKELRKPKGSDLTGGEKLSQVMKPAENVKPSEQNLSVWNGWLPTDMMERLHPLMQDNDGRITQDQKNENNRRQFPFPIIWMSPNDKQAEGEKEELEVNTAPEAAKDQGANKPHMSHESSGEQFTLEPNEQVSKHKIIPVKQMEAPTADDSENAQRKEEDRMVKASRASAKGQPLSPSKKSKLPPVCLRVDPLPRKRNGKTNSRSPSPPGSKGQPHETMTDAPNVSVSSNLKPENDRSSQVQECTLSCSKEPEAKESSGMDMEAVKEHNKEKKDELQSSYHSNSGKEASSSITVKKTEMAEECMHDKDKTLSNADALTAAHINEREETINADADGSFSKVEEKKLSAEEAALRIQSIYRGFEVRKWEPLKKLKQIAKVQEQMVDVTNKISDLESSPNLQKDEKQTAIIGEMIMNLLLKLDTIQGLHPNLRDLRKSLARELVTLQEKLDLFTKAKSSEEPSVDPNSTDIKERLLMDVKAQPDHGVSQQKDVVLEDQDKETLKPSLAEEKGKLEHDDLPEAGNLESHFKCAEDTVCSGELPPSEVLTTEDCIPRDIEQASGFPSERSDSEMAGAQFENKFHQNNGVQVEPVEMNESLHMGDSHGATDSEVYLEGLGEKESVASTKEELIFTGQGAVESSLLGELPVGVIDDESDNQENKVLEHDPSIDALEQQPMESCREQQVTTDVSLLDKEAPDMSEFELERPPMLHEGLTETVVPLPDKEVPSHHLVEGFDEEVSVAKPNGEKFAIQKDDFLGKETSEVNAKETRSLEADAGAEYLGVSQQEKMQQATSPMPEESWDEVQKVDQDIVDISSSHISEAETTTAISQVGQVQIGEAEDNVCQPAARDENKDGADEHHELKVSNSNGVANQANSSEKETAVVSAASQPSVEEQGMEMVSDKKLIEENEKMRLMVEKLVESGKQLLAVISNLTGRVKDLEKKLSKRRARARRCRTVSSKSASPTRSSEPRKKTDTREIAI